MTTPPPAARRSAPRPHGRASLPRTIVVAALLALPTAFLSAGAPAAVDLRALDAYLERARADWDVPGMSVAIVKDGGVVHAKGYGVRERGDPGRVDADTLFAIASNTKAFTAATVAALVADGAVDWDDPVREHLPWLELRDPLATTELRVRDLLCHRSGLGTFSGDLLWYGTPYSATEVLRRARYLHPAGSFRARYGYSNVMYVAAGEVVATASGMPWTALIRDRFLRPLGMARTRTSVEELAAMDNVATPHGPVGSGARPFPWYSWDAAAAAAGIVSSANDMARWLLLQLGRGTLDGRTYYTDAASRTMWTPHMSFEIDARAAQRFPSTHFRGYGLGWDVRDYRGRFVATHGGAYDGMYSRVAVVPEERLAFVVLTNAMTGIGDWLMWRVLDSYLGGTDRDWSREGLAVERQRLAKIREQRAAEAKARVDDAPPSLPLAEYAGTYGGPLYGNARVDVEADRLVLRLQPNPDLVADLTPWQFDTFHLRWRREFPWFGEGRAQFVLDQFGRPTELKLDVPNEDFWFHELELRRRPPAAP